MPEEFLGAGNYAKPGGKPLLQSGTATAGNAAVFAADGVLEDGGTPGGSGITELTGDVTAGPGSGAQAATLADTTVTPGDYTSADITVDQQGRITAAANGVVTIVIPPTSDPAIAGAIWNDAGTLSISAG